MKIAVNQMILNADGTEWKSQKIDKVSGEIVNDKGALLFEVLIESLNTSLKSDIDEPETDKRKRWNLSKRIARAKGDLLELNLEEAAFIKARVNKTHTTVIFGNVDDMFETAADPKE